MGAADVAEVQEGLTGVHGEIGFGYPGAPGEPVGAGVAQVFLRHGPNGEPFTLVIGAIPAGVFREQIHLTDAAAAATVDFARPYEPAATTQLTTADGIQSGFGDPFAAMWASVNARLAGQHPADLPTSADLALRVEDLALAMAGLARPGARTRKDS